MKQLGFFVCHADLEDELIRALGTDGVLEVISAQRGCAAFETFREQPAQRRRAVDAQLRRFTGTRFGTPAGVRTRDGRGTRSGTHPTAARRGPRRRPLTASTVRTARGTGRVRWRFGSPTRRSTASTRTRPGHRLLLIEVADLQDPVGRMHLDLAPTDRTRDEEIERALDLGAREVVDRRRPDGSGWMVFEDPAGNRFCIVRGEAERAAQDGDLPE